MRSRFSVWGLWVALAALCFVRGTAAQAQAAESWQQSPVQIFDVCRGQLVTGVLDVHTVMRTMADAGGGFHQYTKVDASGTGTTPDGTVYVIHETGPAAGDNTNGNQNETYSLIEIQLITKGPEPNSLVHLLVHTTWNANGVQTNFVFHDTEKCVG